ncbi:MAG TPA: NFACT RNA binding domain-containing protein [Thermomicrobiales bacterium]|nr:NFACT RNA binding domain-containing protein [Thermomicrobiales bacterium]
MFDALTIAAIADQLTTDLTNGRIQRLGLADPRTLVAEVYAGGRRRTLVASADDRRPRLLVVDGKPPIDPALVTPFVLLLRKYVRGGVIVGFDQPPLERLVRISIAKRIFRHNAAAGQDEPAEGEEIDPELDEELETGVSDAVFVHLVVEIMGRHSNLILVDDDDVVMESVKRVTPRMSRVRQVMPRIAYSLPPPPDKLDPRRITTAELTPLLRSAPDTTQLSGWLVQQFRGMSPQMAREIVFQVAGSADATIADTGGDTTAIARETRKLLEPLLTADWAPRVYRDAQGTVFAFSPVPMAHLAAEGEEVVVDDIFRAAELSLAGGEADTPARHDQRRQRLAQAIGDARKRVETRLAALREQNAKAEAAEQLRTWGELIYAYLWKIQPGDAELDADGVRIPLDPKLSGKENAQEYFDRYRRAQHAGDQLPALMERATAEISYLDQLTTQVRQAETFADLEALDAEWESYRAESGRGGEARPKSAPAPKRPKALTDAQGNAIYIGRSGAQNDLVTFDIAGPNDTWLHARGVPGSHVIIRWHNATGDENDDTLEQAAALAAYYSSGRDSSRVEVDITRRRYVRKIKGAGPGMVTYRNERTIAVHPSNALEDE